MDLLCFCSVLCLLCLCARLFICALWSPAGKELTSWFSFAGSNCEFVTFNFGILGQVWYLIVSIPDLCTLTYFYKVWEINMEVYPHLELDDITLISCLGYDSYIYVEFNFVCNSIVNFWCHV